MKKKSYYRPRRRENYNGIQGVYIIHADEKLANHAQHYIGYSSNIGGRLYEHKTQQGSKMLAAMVRKGINFRISLVFRGESRKFERALKNLKNIKHYCPLCNEKPKRVPKDIKK